jgi:hypothetical protein
VYFPILQIERFDPAFQANLDFQFSQSVFQCVKDVFGALGDREIMESVFRRTGNAPFLHPSEQIIAAEPVQGRNHKSAAGTEPAGQGRRFESIGEIAAAAAGGGQFSAELFLALEQQDRRSRFGRGNGRHHSGGSTANNDNGWGVISIHRD